MYLTDVSTRRIEDVSEILWVLSVSAATVSNLNDKAFKAVHVMGLREAFETKALGMADELDSMKLSSMWPTASGGLRKYLDVLLLDD